MPLSQQQSMQGANPGYFNGDPAMIQMQASVQQALAFAEQEAMREMRQLLIDYGDPELTAKYLNEDLTGGGEYWTVDQPTRNDMRDTRGFTEGDFYQRLQKSRYGPSPLQKNQWGSRDLVTPSAEDRAAQRGQGPTQFEIWMKDPANAAQYRAYNDRQAWQNRQYGSEAQARFAQGVLGAPGVTRNIRGKGVNVLAAENNPYSVLKQLTRMAGQEMYDANDTLNKSNLWYSSERGRVLGELGTVDQQRRYEAAQTVQQQLAAIQSQLTQAQLDAQNQLAQQTLQSQQNRNQSILSQMGGR